MPTNVEVSSGRKLGLVERLEADPQMKRVLEEQGLPLAYFLDELLPKVRRSYSGFRHGLVRGYKRRDDDYLLVFDGLVEISHRADEGLIFSPGSILSYSGQFLFRNKDILREQVDEKGEFVDRKIFLLKREVEWILDHFVKMGILERMRKGSSRYYCDYYYPVGRFAVVSGYDQRV